MNETKNERNIKWVVRSVVGNIRHVQTISNQSRLIKIILSIETMPNTEADTQQVLGKSSSAHPPGFAALAPGRRRPVALLAGWWGVPGTAGRADGEASRQPRASRFVDAKVQCSW